HPILSCVTLYSAFVFTAAGVSGLVPGTAAASENWPEFRGPGGDGHATGANLPLTWSESENVAWKTPIHGKGWSSPVIWGNQVWMTTATPEGHAMFAVCVDKDSGKIIHDVKLWENDNPAWMPEMNSYASCTPVIEVGRVYV